MNDDLQKQLAELLKQLMAVANDAGKWVAGQLPPLVQEKILFGRIEEVVQLIVLVAALWYCATLCRRCVLRLVASNYDDELGWILGSLATGAASVALFIFGGVQLHAALMVWFAPRLYIVEWLASLVKK